jgi:hypothetical protein
MVGHGGEYAYDVLVNVKSLPEGAIGDVETRIHTSDGFVCVMLATATRPEGMRAMEPGPDRYRAWLAHEAEVRREMLGIACGQFPELEELRRRGVSELPLLWVTYDPDPDLPSKTVTVAA